MRKSIFDLTIVAIFTGILFTIEQGLAFIPNVQLTVFLLVLYTKTIGFKKTLLIAIIHTLLDNLYNGTMLFHLVIPMMIGWSLIPILLSTVFRKFESAFSLSIFAFMFGFIYGWIFIPFVAYTFGYPIIAYFLSDLPFELMMATSGALSVSILYQPVYVIISREMTQYHLLEQKRFSNI